MLFKADKLKEEANKAIQLGQVGQFREMMTERFKEEFGCNFRKLARRHGQEAANVMRQIVFLGCPTPQQRWDARKQHDLMYGEMMREIRQEQVAESFEKLGLKKNHKFIEVAA